MVSQSHKQAKESGHMNSEKHTMESTEFPKDKENIYPTGQEWRNLENTSREGI